MILEYQTGSRADASPQGLEPESEDDAGERQLQEAMERSLRYLTLTLTLTLALTLTLNLTLIEGY